MPQSVEGWENMPVLECGEGLVCLNKLPMSRGVMVMPQYWNAGVSGAIPEQYVRESVATRLIKAASLLPRGCGGLLTWDAWRPLEVQNALFDGYYTDIRRANPSLSQAEVEVKAQTFVSLPSEVITRPSPHFTGGSWDGTIIGANGLPLWMGTSFDHFGPEAATNFFEDSSRIKSRMDWVARQNRRLLCYVMKKVGLTNYSEEWWHFDFGNQFWAKVSGGERAFLGPIDLRMLK
jgi:zinc D-Ala-D-Ala dipeptidase